MAGMFSQDPEQRNLQAAKQKAGAAEHHCLLGAKTRTLGPTQPSRTIVQIEAQCISRHAVLAVIGVAAYAQRLGLHGA